MGLLDGRAAVVTGGGRGIGRGHCLHLAENGAAVIVNDLEPNEAQKVVEDIATKGGVASANGDDIGTRAGARSTHASRYGSFFYCALSKLLTLRGTLRCVDRFCTVLRFWARVL